MEQTIKKISSNDLLNETNLMKNSGYRLVAISCTSKDGIELTYSFDKDFDFINLRINMDYDVEIESIKRHSKFDINNVGLIQMIAPTFMGLLKRR